MSITNERRESVREKKKKSSFFVLNRSARDSFALE